MKILHIPSAIEMVWTSDESLPADDSWIYVNTCNSRVSASMSANTTWWECSNSWKFTDRFRWNTQYYARAYEFFVVDS